MLKNMKIRVKIYINSVKIKYYLSKSRFYRLKADAIKKKKGIFAGIRYVCDDMKALRRALTLAEENIELMQFLKEESKKS